METLLATPPIRLTAGSNTAPFSKNRTVPVGVPPPDTGLTVAVKVTPWPTADGLTEETTLVEVRIELLMSTRTTTPGDVDVPK